MVSKLIAFEKGVEEFTGESVVSNLLLKLYYETKNSSVSNIICAMKFFKDSDVGP